MTREDVTNLLGVLQETYGKTFANPSGTVDAWLITLASYDARSIFKAARLYMESKTIKNFPSPADLIALITRAELVYPDEVPEPPKRFLESTRAIVTKLDGKIVDEYLDSLSEWIGLGSDQNDDALEEFYRKHPEARGILPYET